MRELKKLTAKGWLQLARPPVDARKWEKAEFEASIDYAIEALDKAEKYRWHDLQKNPNDLPNEDGLYWVHGVWGSGKHQEGECEYKTHDGYFSASWNFNVIAWKEIEKYEVKA